MPSRGGRRLLPMLLLFLPLLLSAHALPVSNDVKDAAPKLELVALAPAILAALFLVTLVLLLSGCVCCRTNKFTQFTNATTSELPEMADVSLSSHATPSVTVVDTGIVNPIAEREFTIFGPLSPENYPRTRGSELPDDHRRIAQIQFYGPPEIDDIVNNNPPFENNNNGPISPQDLMNIFNNNAENYINNEYENAAANPNPRDDNIVVLVQEEEPTYQSDIDFVRVEDVRSGRLESHHDWFDNPNEYFPRNNLQYLQEIGRGWFGRIVEAEARNINIPHEENHLSLETPSTSNNNMKKVAVKILDENVSVGEKCIFLEECKLYKNSDDKNVLKLLGFSLGQDPWLMIFEYCSLGDLKTFLRYNLSSIARFNERGIPLKFQSDVASALSYLHCRDIIHPDIACHSCMVTENYTVKLGDYGGGLYQHPSDYYAVYDKIVPIRWLAPECWGKYMKMTKEANMWSFGVFLWESCSWGSLPYDKLTDENVISNVLVKNGTRLQEPIISNAYGLYLYQIMQSCWQEKDTDRITAAHTLSLLNYIYSNYYGAEGKVNLCFEDRWQKLKPNCISKIDNETKNFKFTADADSLCPPESECSTDALEDFSEKTKSDSLTNLHGSFESIQERSVMENEQSAFKGSEKSSFSNKSNCEVAPWLQDLPVTSQEDMSYIKTVSDVISDLDNMLSSEKTSSSESSHQTSPSRDVSDHTVSSKKKVYLRKDDSDYETEGCNSEQTQIEPENVPDNEKDFYPTLDFRLAKLECYTSDDVVHPMFQTKCISDTQDFDSLQDTSYIPEDKDSKVSSQDEVKNYTSSGSETEDEIWKKRVEMGVISEKIKLKSKSVTDFMVLTHIDMDFTDFDSADTSYNSVEGKLFASFIDKKKKPKYEQKDSSLPVGECLSIFRNFSCNDRPEIDMLKLKRNLRTMMQRNLRPTKSLNDISLIQNKNVDINDLRNFKTNTDVFLDRRNDSWETTKYLSPPDVMVSVPLEKRKENICIDLYDSNESNEEFKNDKLALITSTPDEITCNGEGNVNNKNSVISNDESVIKENEKRSTVSLGPFMDCTLDLYTGLKTNFADHNSPISEEEALMFSSNFNDVKVKDDESYDLSPKRDFETSSAYFFNSAAVPMNTMSDDKQIDYSLETWDRFLGTSFDNTSPQNFDSIFPEESCENYEALRQRELNNLTSKLAMAENENNLNIEHLSHVESDDGVDDLPSPPSSRDENVEDLSFPEAPKLINDEICEESSEGWFLHDRREEFSSNDSLSSESFSQKKRDSDITIDPECVKALRTELELKLPLAQMVNQQVSFENSTDYVNDDKAVSTSDIAVQTNVKIDPKKSTDDKGSQITQNEILIHYNMYGIVPLSPIQEESWSEFSEIVKADFDKSDTSNSLSLGQQNSISVDDLPIDKVIIHKNMEIRAVNDEDSQASNLTFVALEECGENLKYNQKLNLSTDSLNCLDDHIDSEQEIRGGVNIEDYPLPSLPNTEPLQDNSNTKSTEEISQNVDNLLKNISKTLANASRVSINAVCAEDQSDESSRSLSKTYVIERDDMQPDDTTYVFNKVVDVPDDVSNVSKITQPSFVSDTSDSQLKPSDKSTSQRLHTKTPSMDSWCSNDTLFNVEENFDDVCSLNEFEDGSRSETPTNCETQLRVVENCKSSAVLTENFLKQQPSVEMVLNCIDNAKEMNAHFIDLDCVMSKDENEVLIQLPVKIQEPSDTETSKEPLLDMSKITPLISDAEILDDQPRFSVISEPENDFFDNSIPKTPKVHPNELCIGATSTPLDNENELKPEDKSQEPFESAQNLIDVQFEFLDKIESCNASIDEETSCFDFGEDNVENKNLGNNCSISYISAVPNISCDKPSEEDRQCAESTRIDFDEQKSINGNDDSISYSEFHKSAERKMQELENEKDSSKSPYNETNAEILEYASYSGLDLNLLKEKYDNSMIPDALSFENSANYRTYDSIKLNNFDELKSSNSIPVSSGISNLNFAGLVKEFTYNEEKQIHDVCNLPPECLKDWDSGSDESNANSSSSGEFTWKNGEAAEPITLSASICQSPYSSLKTKNNFAQECNVIEEEPQQPNSDDSDDSSDEDVQFVPSSWNYLATPGKSSLKSPETSQRETKKKVAFKKQKHNCVYEYPREISDNETESPMNFGGSSFTDWQTYCNNEDIDPHFERYEELCPDYLPTDVPDGDFYVSPTSAPFESYELLNSSQFFPGAINLYDAQEIEVRDEPEILETNNEEVNNIITTIIENAKSSDFITPDSGNEDVTPGSLLDYDFKGDYNRQDEEEKKNNSNELRLNLVNKKLSSPNGGSNVLILPDKSSPSGSTTPSGNSSNSSGANSPLTPTSVLGGLRHTRDKLKLDLPQSPLARNSPNSNKNSELKVFDFRNVNGQLPTNNEIINVTPDSESESKDEKVESNESSVVKSSEKDKWAMDSHHLDINTLQKAVVPLNLIEKHKKSILEPVKGEGTLLDSGDEDSGIGSSAYTTLERKIDVDLKTESGER